MTVDCIEDLEGMTGPELESYAVRITTQHQRLRAAVRLALAEHDRIDREGGKSPDWPADRPALDALAALMETE